MDNIASKRAQNVVIFAYTTSSIERTVREINVHSSVCSCYEHERGIFLYSCISLNDLIPNLSNDSEILDN